MIFLVLLHEAQRSSSASDLIISYEHFLLTFGLYNYDLPGFACEFQVSSELYKLVLVLLYEIKRSSGLSELHINYEQYLLTFEPDP